MIFVAIEVPPPLYPLPREEQRIEFDPREWGGTMFRVAPLNVDPFVGSAGTSNAPNRSAKALRSIFSLRQIRTSASTVDRAVERASAEAARELGVAGQLADIKRLTGYSWEQLAGILDCTRQALHRWMNGDAIADGNRERLARLHATLRYIDRGNAEENRMVLGRAYDGWTLAELLRKERFDEVKAVAQKGAGRSDASWGFVNRDTPDAESHWYTRLVQSDDAEDGEIFRAKPQTFRRLQLRKD